MSVPGPFIRRYRGRRTTPAYVDEEPPSSARLRTAFAGLILLLLPGPRSGLADGVVDAAVVRVINASRATRCAEEDNIYAPLFGSQVARFRIEARHPAYIKRLSADNSAADFTNCDMRGDPAFDFLPRTVTLVETAELALVGHTFPRFWRPETVPVRVGSRTEDGLHLLQLFLLTDRRRVEFLVLYPSDGYWRLKPLPTAPLADGAYGSSFLIGPIEEQGRPLVRLTSVTFDPGDRTFHLQFRSGGQGSVRVDAINDRQAVLEVALDPPVKDGRPFAALRSMFVSPQVADVAEVAWRAEPEGWRVQTIGKPFDEPTTAVRFGRSDISTHNSSAPDLLFEGFRAAPKDR